MKNSICICLCCLWLAPVLTSNSCRNQVHHVLPPQEAPPKQHHTPIATVSRITKSVKTPYKNLPSFSELGKLLAKLPLPPAQLHHHNRPQKSTQHISLPPIEQIFLALPQQTQTLDLSTLIDRLSRATGTTRKIALLNFIATNPTFDITAPHAELNHRSLLVVAIEKNWLNVFEELLKIISKKILNSDLHSPNRDLFQAILGIEADDLYNDTQRGPIITKLAKKTDSLWIDTLMHTLCLHYTHLPPLFHTQFELNTYNFLYKLLLCGMSRGFLHIAQKHTASIAPNKDNLFSKISIPNIITAYHAAIERENFFNSIFTTTQSTIDILKEKYLGKTIANNMIAHIITTYFNDPIEKLSVHQQKLRYLCEDAIRNDESIDISRVDEDLHNMLMLAVCCNDEQLVDYCIGNNSPVTNLDCDGLSLLGLAVKYSSVGVARKIIALKKEVPKQTQRLLFFAASNKPYGTNMMKWLLSSDGPIKLQECKNVNKIDEHSGLTPLMVCIANDNIDTAAYLLSNGAMGLTIEDYDRCYHKKFV